MRTRTHAIRTFGLIGLVAGWALIASDWAHAAPVDQNACEQVAARVVAERYSHLTAAAAAEQQKPGAKPREVPAQIPAPKGSDALVDADGKTLGYVVHLQPRGFVITSADTDLTPILAFSLTNDFSLDDVPQNIGLKLVRYDLQKRVAFRAKAQAKDLSETTDRWNTLLGGEAEGDEGQPKAGSQIWGPLVDTRWGQSQSIYGWYYNQRCPVDPVTGMRCVTGCAATASAQIMNYWMWPHSVDFTGCDPCDPNYWRPDPGSPDGYEHVNDNPNLPILLDSPGETYLSVMSRPDEPTRYIQVYAELADIPSIIYEGGADVPTDPPADMVARIMFACGVATHMGYSSSGSGGGCGLGRFGYSSGGSLNPSLKLGQPAFCVISNVLDPNGDAHAIVCDGLWETTNPTLQPTMYHLNFGWNGSTDGWYANTVDGMPVPWSAFGASVYRPVSPVISLTQAADTAMDGVPYTLASPPEITLGTRSRPVTWAFTGSTTPPTGLTIDPVTGVISWPSPDLSGSPYALEIEASNEAGTAAPVTFTLTVEPAPPVIAEIADETAADDETYTGPTPTLEQGSVPIEWSLQTGPAGMTVDANTGVVTWPAPTPAGSPHTVTIRATYTADPNLHDDETWQLAVVAKPIIDPVDDATISVGQPYTFTPTVPAGSLPVTWALQEGPQGMSINPNTGQVIWASPVTTGEPVTVTVHAQNAAGEDTESWELTVTIPPGPPAIADIDDDTIPEGDPYTGPTPTLTAGTLPVTWSLVNPPVGMTIDPGTGVIAWPDPGAAGSPYMVTLQASNSEGDGQTSFTLEVQPAGLIGERYAVIAGVSIYSDPYNNLSYCDDDAIELRDALLEDPEWKSENIELLTDNQATKGNIQSAIQAMADKAGPDDLCLFFFSGHGGQVPDAAPLDEQDGWDETLCPHDIANDIRDDELSDWIGMLPTQRVVVMIDTCHSGGNIKGSLPPGVRVKGIPSAGGGPAPGDGFAADLRPVAAQKDLDDLAGIVVLTACDDTEFSYEIPSLQNGLFTYYLLEAMATADADTSTNGMICGEEAHTYLLPRVIDYLGGFQTPQLHDGNGDDQADYVASKLTKPAIAEIPDAEIPEAQPYTGPTPVITQGEGPTFSLLQGPTGMQIDENTGVVTWPLPTLAGSPHTVTIAATNGVGTDTESWTLTVVPSPPDIAAIDDDQVAVGEPYTGPTPSATGSTPINWTLRRGPTGMTIDPATGVVSWDPASAAASPYTITVRATYTPDPSFFDEASWTLTVVLPPEIAALSDDEAVADTPYTSAEPVVTSGTLPVDWSLPDANNVDLGMTIDPSTGAVSWPNPTLVGSPFTVTVQAENLAGSDQQTFTLSVVPAPEAPVITSLEDPSDATEGVAYTGPTPTVTGTAPITWTLSLAPSGMTVDSTTGVVAWPNPVDNGMPRRVILCATNEAGSDEREFFVEVVPPPTPPTIGDIEDAEVTKGQAYTSPTPTVTGSAPITWSLPDPNNTANGMTVDPDTGVVSWPHPTTDGSPYTLTLRATNDTGQDEQTWILTVLEVPVAPELATLDDDQAVHGQPYTGPIPALIKGGVVSWTLVDAPQGMTIDPNTGVVAWPKPKASTTPYTITIRAQNQVGSADVSFQLTVGLPDVAPVIDPIADQEVLLGQPFSGPAPTLSQGTAPVAWSIVAGAPAGMRIDPDTGVVTWPAATGAGEVYAITVRATNIVGSDDETWTLTVNTPMADVAVGVSPADAGLTVSVDGVPYTGFKTFTWQAGSTHQITASAGQLGTDGAEYLFVQWSDGDKTLSRTITAATDASYKVEMKKVVPMGMAIAGPDEVNEDTANQFTATVTFSNGATSEVTSEVAWAVSVPGCAAVTAGNLTTLDVPTDTYCEVYATHSHAGKTVTARKSIMIRDVAKTFNVVVRSQPGGTTSPARLSGADGTVLSIPVPAPPADDMVFVGWGGDASGFDDPLIITVDRNKQVIANFEKADDLVPTAGMCATPASLVGLLLMVGFSLLRGSLRPVRRGDQTPVR